MSVILGTATIILIFFFLLYKYLPKEEDKNRMYIETNAKRTMQNTIAAIQQTRIQTNYSEDRIRVLEEKVDRLTKEYDEKGPYRK